MRKFGKLTAVLLVLALVFGVFVVIAGATSDTETDTGADTAGRTFTSSDELSMTVPLDAQPMTYKALVSVPAEADTRGVIFGNYRESDIQCVNFEITAEGNPSLYFIDYIDSAYVPVRIEFDYDVRGLGYVDLTVTHTVTDTGSEFTLYADGVSVATESSEYDLLVNVVSAQRQYRFALGHDWYSSGYYFKGAIKNVAIYGESLDADAVSSAYSEGVDLSDSALMAYWDLTLESNRTGWPITDSTDGSHDFEPLFQDTRRDFEYAYSLAVVGDTQHLVYRDAHYRTAYTALIYDWIVKNKDLKNIKFVMGLGDITNRDGVDDIDDGVDNTDVEWELAVEQLNKLYEANIPYSLVSGNHDTVAQLDKFFADDPNFTGADISYYSGSSLGNYTMKFTADTTDYMVVALDYGADDNILAWAGAEIEANPDRKVIITTHAYMCADGTTLESTDSTSVPRPENPNASEKTKNNGDDIWHELASRYENVMLVLSGHIAASDVIYRKDYGDNGNTVYQMLINFQTMDTKYSRETGMVAMFYFSEDGKVVNVEYVSAYKSLEAQTDDESAKDIVFRPAVNSFSFEYPDEKGVGEETEYGVISPAYLDAETYPVVVFKSDKTFVGGFYELNHAMQSLVSVYNDKTASYVLYFRGDSVNTSDVVSLGTFNGEILIDLNGATVRNTPNYLMNFTFSGDSANSPSVTVKNGTLIKDGNTLGLIKFDYDSTLSGDARCDITFENVTFRSLVNYNKNTSVVFVTYEAGYTDATAVVRVNATFNDCTFDYVNSVSGAVMIPMKHYYNTNVKDRVIFNTQVNGGNALYTSASAFTSYFTLLNDDKNGRADTVKYGRNSAGSYLTLQLPAGSGAPTASFPGADGENCVFNAVDSEDDTAAVYTLINADSLETEYGTLGAEYENADTYPVVVFKKADTSDTWTFVGGYADFGKATQALKYNSGMTSVVLLRKDTTSSALLKMDSFKGTYIVDLNGYTLTQTANELFTMNRTSTSADATEVTEFFTLSFINGTVVNESDKTMISVNYGAGSKASSQSYSVEFNFENVVFKTTNEARAIFANWESGVSVADENLKILVTATFTDCTFDFTGSGSDFIMIDMCDDKASDGADRTIYDVTVNGGTIISPRTFDKAHFIAMDGDTNGRADKVTFGKNGDGEYITLLLPNTVEAPSESEIYSNASGAECIFAKAYELDGETVYRIRPVATLGIDFTPKMSLTLDRDLIMNIYIPKEILVKFTLDGEEHADPAGEALETVTLDDKEYYLMKISLPASEAARSVKLTATVSSGEITASATFSFSIPKYAEKLLADGTDAEQSLVLAVLQYIRAAYAYFGTEDEEQTAKLNELLGDYAAAPTIEGSSEAAAEGLDAVTFVLDGTPSMRFYFAEGADASKYKFYIGGEQVMTELAEDSSYVDIDVYAYALCETVTYTVDGEEGGSFHINAYYENVSGDGESSYTGDDKEELTALTAAFWKYLQSARDYRKSVIGS